MSLIEKIDAEIAELVRRRDDNLDISKHGITVCAINNQIHAYQKAKAIILSEQKEPCEGVYITTQEPETSHLTADFIKDCELTANQYKKILTIGDKIRESNESLSAFIRGQSGDDRVFHGGNQIDLDEFLSQPYTDR